MDESLDGIDLKFLGTVTKKAGARPEKVGLRKTDVEKPSVVRRTLTSKNGSVPLPSVSIVNLMAGCFLLR